MPVVSCAEQAANVSTEKTLAQSLKFRHSKHNPSDKHEDVHHTRETPVRHGGLLSAAGSAARYTAFSSDVGEALRPVLSSKAVNATYGIALGYVVCDIGYHGWLAQSKKQDVSRALVHASTFQLFGSVLLPFGIIHTAVHTGHNFFHKIGRFTKWGPSIIGLCLVPVLPSVCDEPVEHAVDWAFDKYWPKTDKKDE